MQKLILLSVVLATFAVPALVARDSSPLRYRTVLVPFAVFAGIYVALLLFVYPRLF